MIRNLPAILAAFAICASAASLAKAGPFDCSVAYDEFDSFMNKSFLMKPDAYVSTAQDKLTRDEFRAKQSKALLLTPSRKGQGVAIVHTNGKAHGKFLFSWSGRGDLRGTPLLILRDVSVFKNVQNGDGLKKFREIRVTAAQTIDLDTGKPTQDDSADILYQTLDAKTVSLEAVNGARLFFPMETLCK